MKSVVRLVDGLYALSLLAVAVGGCATMSLPSGTTPVDYVTPEILDGEWTGTFERSNIMWLSAKSVQQPTTMAVSAGNIRWRYEGSRGRWYGGHWRSVLIDGTAYVHVTIPWSDIDATDETIPVRVSENADAYFMAGHFNVGGANNLNGDFLVRRPKTPADMARQVPPEEGAVPIEHVTKDMLRGTWSGSARRLDSPGAPQVPAELEIMSSIVTWRTGPEKSHQKDFHISEKNGDVQHFIHFSNDFSSSKQAVEVFDASDKYLLRWYPDSTTEAVLSRMKRPEEMGKQQ